jgi:DNA-binding PadR family transcriptional regulator
MHSNGQIGGFGLGRGQRCGSGHQGRMHHGAGQGHDAASLHLATLAILADQPGNGLAVMKALTTLDFCPATAEASTVCPTLSLLTDIGMISATTEPAGQTIYTVLDEGAAMLASNRLLIETIMAETAPGQGPSGESRKDGRRRRHCRGQQAAPESAPAA